MRARRTTRRRTLRKILLIARRDYLASIRTKAFLFGLLAAPLLFGSGFIGLAIMRGKPDIKPRRIAIVDFTGVAAPAVIEAAERANREELNDKITGRQAMPLYTFETVAPAADIERQRLALSDRVRNRDLYAFIEIGAKETAWYSNEGGAGNGRRWISGPLSNGLRRVELSQAGVNPSRLDDILKPNDLQSMNLLAKDVKTGRLVAAGKKNETAVFIVPISLAMLLFMIVMTTSAPMLPAIAEDKMQRVFEMLLASATPFELIAGKVLAALGRSLTSSVVYIGIALMALNAFALMGFAPIELLPWFFVYLVAEVTMLCAIASALGAACGSPQDAQSLGGVLFAPILIPIMTLTPIIQQPNSSFATVMSLIPPFTPLLMLTRQALPGGVPVWQPIAGLAGIVCSTFAISWIAARVFRITILMQGKPPSVAELARWAVKG